MPAASPEGLDASRLFQRLSRTSPVALAVSGGSDSMAMLRLFAAWPDRPPATVLTVDHGLRAEAAAEARQVAQWAMAAGLPHVTLRWQGDRPRSGIQAKARAARYDLMTGWCRAHGASPLLTAHTEDDQAETFLMRLSRTTSFESLAGIAAVGSWKGIGLHRPLLGLSRARLRAYLVGLGQGWIDDPSNDDERFERVRIRKAMPLLAGLGIEAAALARAAREMQAVSEVLKAAASDWCAVHLKSFAEGYGLVPIAALQAEPPAVRQRILGQLIRRFGGGQGPEPSELSLLMAWLDGSGSRRTLGGALIGRRKDHLVIGREPGRVAGLAQIIPAEGRLAWDHRFLVEGPPGSAVNATGQDSVGRNPRLPAFVQQTLPAIRLPDGSLCIPQLGIGQGANATFLPELAG